MALPHPCRAYSPAAALRTGKACAPLLAARGSLATTPLLRGWLPSVTASRLPRLQRLIRFLGARLPGPSAARAMSSHKDHGRLGTFPSNTSPAPGVSEVVAPLSLRHPHLRSSSLFQEGGAAAKVRTQQKRPGPRALPRGDALLRGGPRPG